MNNFTTTTAAVPKKESLPRSGHVNEVCKEWLVREDGALAYKLQSQEINDFYKGNRYRNAVVREDFPTALHEQIKETEQAQRQVEAYRRRLTEQEEHDKRVAKEIADKLERDLQEQQQEELQQSELIAQKMQEIYVNLPPVPPPTTRDKSRPPPRPAKASIRQQQLQLQQQQQQQSNGSLEPSTSQQARYHSQQQQQQQQQQHFSQTDNYKLSPEKYDQMVGNFALGNSKAAERHMQQHADDIELYVDPCDYASLRDIGVPPEEIHEMSKKIKQEQKDELLARRLQAIESKDSVRQEQRDRLLAIEAQDKELAKMLQERYGKNIFKLRKFKISAVKEKAKVKRAKEKARLRKSQQKDVIGANGVGVNGLLCGTNGSSHCGPLMALPQDCMSSSQTPADIDVEAYSNPIDVLNNSREQRQPNGTLTNGSLTRDSSSSTHGSMQRQQRQAAAAASSLTRGEDDIYTLPVDSCRLAGNGQRPISLHLAAETVQQLQQQQQQQHNSMTRSENYGSEAGSHDSTLSSGHDVSPHMKYSKSGNFGIYIQAPVPRRLICQFRVRADQIQVKIVKRNRRTTSARISETAFR
ncbi:mediator of RNA polymerase II transcription subunit 15 isoform X4 [Drosophila grimshawi]|uniref:mediator of RNA polymerase II transcription subunit 15 isoform X4 n=1 Tax=Drosophila grimshawi TaxID=7222 RepID=UPI001C93247B|nr:mediator of RNA polymerase II transcription subunit 15 isoform X4 [Drosophila grimshawi]